MKPTTAHTTDAMAYWAGHNPQCAVFTAPSDPSDALPCEAIVTCDPEIPGRHIIRVPWKPNELDVAALAQGGTIWLSCWDQLPAHMLEVQHPGEPSRSDDS